MIDFNASGTAFHFDKGFTIDFDLKTGLSTLLETGKRRLSDMRDMYADKIAFDHMLKQDDSIVYEFHSMPVAERAGDLAFGCSIVYPGQVGREYFMTRGHFHMMLETAETYYCLSGHGYMMMENPEGDWRALELIPGRAVYVPRRYAHRSICVGKSEPLVTFYTFAADAGHDYGTIENKGFRKLLIEDNGQPAVVDNPKWK